MPLPDPPPTSPPSPSDCSSIPGPECEFDLSHIKVPSTPDNTDQVLTQYSDTKYSDNEVECEQGNVQEHGYENDREEVVIANNEKPSEEEEDLEEPISELDQHIRLVFLSRRDENKNLKYRRDLLYSFVLGPALQTHLHKFFHLALKDSSDISELHDKLMATRVKKHRMTSTFVAESMFSLWMVLRKSDALKDQDLVADDTAKRPSRHQEDLGPIKELRSFVKGIIKRKMFDDAKETKKKERKPSTSSTISDFVQDEFAHANPSWIKLIKPTACPLCNHNSIVPHEKEADIIKENKKIEI